MDDFIQSLSDDSIYFIKGDKNARYPNSNSLLIGDYLIDTGVSGKVLKKVKKQHEINHVILSHWHEDHLHGNYLFPNAIFYSHINDKPIIEDINKMIPFYKLEGMQIGEDLKNLLTYMKIKNTLIDKTIDGGDIFKIKEDIQFHVLHTPGHTAGHCTFHEPRSKIGFFGDIDLSKFPYYGNIDADLLKFEESIDKLSKMDFDIVVTGHKGPIMGSQTIKEELEKYRNVLNQRDERILAFFNEGTPTTIEALKKKNLIYKKYYYEEFEIIAELLMIEKHIDKFLIQEVLISKENGFILN
ncbi:MAG: MBL fold metallo-hydrolase [Candidatus Lokiarchaeota archaeon]|nr:MBL fold metallo-hydrolase [Candidatus Lokiarchaeota archaeon]